MKATIWRAIYLDKFEELDLMNFGCHWTKDEFYCTSPEFIYNDISKGKRKGKTQFLFKTDVSKEYIDSKKTKISNKEFPRESERVLK